MRINSFAVHENGRCEVGEVKATPYLNCAFFLAEVRLTDMHGKTETSPSLGRVATFRSLDEDYIRKVRNEDRRVLEDRVNRDRESRGTFKIIDAKLSVHLGLLENHPRRRNMGMAEVVGGILREIPPIELTDEEFILFALFFTPLNRD